MGAKFKFNQKTKKWEEGNVHGSIYLDRALKARLDNVKRILKKKYDCVFCIDGKERIGKSTLGITCGWYLSDEQLTQNNFASGLNDAAKKIKDLPDASVLIVDEGSLMFSSKDAMSKKQKELIKILDVIGQKNMVFIIILPSFFELNKSIAIRRSRFLLHCYSDANLNRGKFVYFGEKRKSKLYEMGKKNFGSYNRPKADFPGSFLDFKPSWYAEYLEIKKKSMLEALDVEKVLVEEDVVKRHALKVITNSKKLDSPLKSKDFAVLFDVSTRTIDRYRSDIRQAAAPIL